MVTEPTNLPSIPSQTTSDPWTFWRRFFAGATALVFIVSSVFPVAAGLSHDTESFPEWWGPLDVGIAFFLGLMVFVIFGMAHGKVNKQTEAASYHAYRFFLHGIFVILIVFVLFGDRIVWPNCLSGLAWRYWLLLYSVPAWLAVWTK